MRLQVLVMLLIGCSPAPRAGITYHGQVRPLVERHCAECHYQNGPGRLVFDSSSITSFAPLMIREIEARRMPPWMPSDLGLAFVGRRYVNSAELEMLQAWAANPAMGNPSEYQAPDRGDKFDPGEGPSTTAMMSVPYQSTAQFSDDIRCFLLDVPSGWIRGYQWVVGSPGEAHHMSADVIGPGEVDKALALSGRDGQPGWPCAFGPGLDFHSLGSLANTAVGPDAGYVYPDGWGIEVPPGAKLALNVHRAVFAAPHADTSGVKLWYAPSPQKRVGLFSFLAPSEIPCPTGISLDPSNPCSRDYALAHSLQPDARAVNDSLWLNCQADRSVLTRLPFGMEAESFPVSSSCIMPATFAGRLLGIRAHAHTKATAVRIEAEQGDGSWRTYFDTSNWNWYIESNYVPIEDINVKSGQRFRLTCTWDNGNGNQWSALTHEPPHFGPSLPPLDRPAYLAFDEKRAGEMCLMSLDIAQ